MSWTLLSPTRDTADSALEGMSPEEGSAGWFFIEKVRTSCYSPGVVVYKGVITQIFQGEDGFSFGHF